MPVFLYGSLTAQDPDVRSCSDVAVSCEGQVVGDETGVSYVVPSGRNGVPGTCGFPNLVGEFGTIRRDDAMTHRCFDACVAVWHGRRDQEEALSSASVRLEQVSTMAIIGVGMEDRKSVV